MTYLITQLWLYLLCAGLLGLLLGWVIWGWWSNRRFQEAMANSERERMALEQAHETERRGFQDSIDAASFERDEALRTNVSLQGELEGERRSASQAKAEAGRLKQGEVALRGEFERSLASVQEELELERGRTDEAKAEAGRLQKGEIALRGEFERSLASVQEELDLERGRTNEAKTTLDTVRADMNHALQSRENELAHAENANGSLRAKLERVEGEVREQQTSLRRALDEERQAKSALEAELRQERAELSVTKDAVDELRAEMSKEVQAKATLETERTGLVSRETEAKAEIERLRADLAAMSASGQGDSEEADRLRRQLLEAGRRQEHLEDEIERLRGLLRQKETISVKSEEKKTFTTDAPRPATLYDRRPDVVDDLKEVKGIGPVMERILNENGCYHFKQLANFSPRDIEWISQALGSFPDRIERDQWVRQAQALHLEKHGLRHDAGEVVPLKTMS